MASRADELEQIKRLDLRVLAAELLGYAVCVRKSSRGSTAMDGPDGNRILIGLAGDGHYVCCSVKGQASGSIIDLYQHHHPGASIGEVRKAVRPFLEGGTGNVPGAPPHRSPVSLLSGLGPLRPIEKDALGVRARYAGFEPVGDHHGYLCDERKLPSAILCHPRFAERIRVDERGNAIFPHFNADGLCGWEARNHGFTSFAAGGAKGLWCSVPAEGDDRLVIVESAIDALSYAAIRGTARARLVSFSGGLNPGQPELLARAMQRMPAGSRIIAAVDNDEAGDRYVDRLAELVGGLDREDQIFVEDRPTGRGRDWNDELRSGSASPRPPEGGRPEPG
ncbi:MAG: DUF3991 domain-containing protein [Phycisphaerales bacterium JB060]